MTAGRKPIEHGTRKGYQQHLRAGHEPCPDCKRATAEYERERRAAAKKKRGKTGKARKKAEREAVEQATEKVLQNQTPINTVPNFLSQRGRDLWEDVTSRYDLSPANLAILGDACRLVDKAERLSAATSNKQTLWFELGDLPDNLDDGIPIVINGILAEHRQTVAAFRQALQAIGVVEKAQPKKVDSRNAAFLEAARAQGLIEGGGSDNSSN